MSEQNYTEGGWIPHAGAAAPIRIAPDECLLGGEYAGQGRAVCVRDDHPTMTSDCATVMWIRHKSSEDGQ